VDLIGTGSSSAAADGDVAQFPLWLEFSGMPQAAAERTKGAAGWLVFRKVVELDIARNRSGPGTVEISLEHLAARIGIECAPVRKALGGLRKAALLSFFLPESDEEEALFRVKQPLPLVLSADEIVNRAAAQHESLPRPWRYLDDPCAEAPEFSENDPILHEIVDLYFNAVGLKMNAFVLDELRLIRERYPTDEIRRSFRRAQKNEIRSLNWVVRELARAAKKKS
jgi:hypothetical protein